MQTMFDITAGYATPWNLVVDFFCQMTKGLFGSHNRKGKEIRTGNKGEESR